MLGKNLSSKDFKQLNAQVFATELPNFTLEALQAEGTGLIDSDRLTNAIGGAIDYMIDVFPVAKPIANSPRFILESINI